MENVGAMVVVVENQQYPKSGDLPEGLVLVSSGSEGDSQDDEQEEGEIQDDDDEEEKKLARRTQLDLEDISSEEESNIRSRMAVLEAMDKEVGLIKKISSRSAYDFTEGKDNMYGKENCLYYYQQKQDYRNHKPVQKTPAGKKQNNHRETSRRERVVVPKRQLERIKEKLKRSTHRRHKRKKRAPAPPQRFPITSDSEPEATVDREYLKIACATENGRKGDNHKHGKNALKNKLFLPTNKRRSRKAKEMPMPSEKHVVEMIVESSSSEHDDDEEQEELQLRLLALRTKPIVKDGDLGDRISDFQVPSPPPPPSMDPLDDKVPSQPVPFEPENVGGEEQELRLIALKSAVLKKHETRLKRKVQDAERPYSPSDDIVLTPIREVPSVRDELDNDLYSDGKGSIEIIDDDNDVQIIENPCELIALDDTDDDGANDMEISPVGSPTVLAGQPDGWTNMMEDSQHPIDMELDSEHSSEPFSESMRDEIRPHSMLMTGGDSCDSGLFTRREKSSPQSPPLTPDSMEEAEAEALRHLLLTKMRQKRNLKISQEQQSVEPVANKAEEMIAEIEHEKLLPAETELEPVTPLSNDCCTLMPSREVWNDGVHPLCIEEHTIPFRSSSQAASQTMNSSLKILVNRTTVRKRRKKSQTIKSSEDSNPQQASKALAIPSLLSSAHPGPLKSSMVRTQKLVNNPNKLINLNQTISPSPPPLLPSAAVSRTESPKDLASVDTFVSRAVAKLVIQLGNSDSDSDVDFGSASPGKEAGASVRPVSTGEGTAASGVRFEEQLDRFLKSVRSKTIASPNADCTDTKDQDSDHSSNNSTLKTSNSTRQHPAKGSVKRSQSISISASDMTPAAVKHLPKSAQMEYMWLVARRAQLEQHKSYRQCSSMEKTASIATNSAAKVQENGLNRESNSIPTLTTDRPAESCDKQPVDESLAHSSAEQVSTQSSAKRKQVLWGGQSTSPSVVDAKDAMERKLQQIRSSIPNLSESSRNRLLLTAEKQLEKHSGTFRHELEQHNATIIEVQQERRDLYQIDNRIELLREKLALLERAREQRRQRSMDTFSSLQASHRKIVASRKRASELERMCYEIGHTIVGKAYQLPSSSNGPVLQEQLRILSTETNVLKAIRKPTLQQFKEQMLATRRPKLMEPSGGTLQNENRKETTCLEGDRGMPENRSPEVDLTSARTVDAPTEAVTRQQEEPERTDSNTTDGGQTENVSLQQEMIVGGGTECNSEEKTERIEIGVTKPSTHANSDQSQEASSQDDQGQIVITEEKVNTEASSSLEHSADGSVTIEDVTGVESIPDEVIPFGKYTSPLLSLKQGVQNIPSGILCPYELGGQCVDRECKFEHFSPQ